MKSMKRGVHSIAAVLILFSIMIYPLICNAGSATVIPINFDNTPNGSVTTPYVGSGSFAFTTDPGNGIWSLADLGAYQFDFTFFAPSTTFTNADLTGTLPDILIILSGSTSNRDVMFGNINTFGDGSSNGSINFLNSSQNMLTFQPTSGGDNATLYSSNFDNFGDYRNSVLSSVPEPSTFLLLGAGLGGLAFLRRRKQ